MLAGLVNKNDEKFSLRRVKAEMPKYVLLCTLHLVHISFDAFHSLAMEQRNRWNENKRKAAKKEKNGIVDYTREAAAQRLESWLEK